MGDGSDDDASFCRGAYRPGTNQRSIEVALSILAACQEDRRVCLSWQNGTRLIGRLLAPCGPEGGNRTLSELDVVLGVERIGKMPVAATCEG